jgi:hypothetical protein
MVPEKGCLAGESPYLRVSRRQWQAEAPGGACVRVNCWYDHGDSNGGATLSFKRLRKAGNAGGQEMENRVAGKMKEKIGSPEFNQAMPAVLIFGCRRQGRGRHVSALLLSLIALFLFGCQQQQSESTVSKSGRTEACPFELSQTFRAAAGDAFDKLQSLESNELQGLLFYQPAYQDAGVTVSKVERVASNADEVKFSDIVALYFSEINIYRHQTQLVNGLQKNEEFDRKNPAIARQVFAEHPDMRNRPTSASILQQLFETEELQKKHRAIIGACLNASHETTEPSGNQPLIDERRKLENERYWAARDAAAARPKRKVNNEPQFVDEARPKPR